MLNNYQQIKQSGIDLSQFKKIKLAKEKHEQRSEDTYIENLKLRLQYEHKARRVSLEDLQA